VPLVLRRSIATAGGSSPNEKDRAHGAICHSPTVPTGSGRWRFRAIIVRRVFLAYYETEEDADAETKDVEKWSFCGGDPLKKDNFQGLHFASGGAGHVMERETRLALSSPASSNG
jgi:hypothetical protein